MSNQTSEQSGNKLETLYHKYEFLIHSYTNKLYYTEILALEKEDIAQELRVKLYTSILGYLKAWKEFRTTGRRKPIPMYYYLRSCLGNHITDFIAKIKRTEEVFVHKTAHGGTGGVKDVGNFNPNFVQIDLGVKRTANINGVDLMQGLEGTDLVIWTLFLKGRNIKEIQTSLKTRLANLPKGPKLVPEVINRQRKRLEKYREQLTLEPTSTFYVKELIED